MVQQRIRVRLYLVIGLFAALCQCGARAGEEVRYQSSSAKTGYAAVITVSGDGRDAIASGSKTGASILVSPWLFRDRGTIGKVWLSWEAEGSRLSILVCQSEGGPAVETVDFGNIWGDSRLVRPYLTPGPPAVLSSLRANFSGHSSLKGGENDDDDVAHWFCSNQSDGEFQRFTKDGGKTYSVPE